MATAILYNYPRRLCSRRRGVGRLVASVCIITGPLNGPVLYCSLVSVVVVCNDAGGRAGRGRVGGRAADTARRASTVTSR